MFRAEDWTRGGVRRGAGVARVFSFAIPCLHRQVDRCSLVSVGGELISIYRVGQLASPRFIFNAATVIWFLCGFVLRLVGRRRATFVSPSWLACLLRCVYLYAKAACASPARFICLPCHYPPSRFASVAAHPSAAYLRHARLFPGLPLCNIPACLCPLPNMILHYALGSFHASTFHTSGRVAAVRLRGTAALYFFAYLPRWR